MSFTAKLMLPPFALVAIAALLDYPRKPGPLATILLLAACIWWVVGIRAVRVYWRGRWAARGARDSWHR